MEDNGVIARGAGKWYVSCLVAFYGVMGLATSVMYIGHDIKGDATVPMYEQGLCFLMTIVSLLYVYKQVIGYLGLMLVSVLAIISGLMVSPDERLHWHVFVLVVLLYAMVPEKKEDSLEIRS